MTVAVASQGQLVTASSEARLTWTMACANEEGGTGDGNSDGNGEEGGGGELSCVLLCGAPEGAHKGALVNCGGTNQTSDGNGACGDGAGGDGGEGALVGCIPLMGIPGDSMTSTALRMAALESLGTVWALLRAGGVTDGGAAHETPGNATNTGNTGNTGNMWWNELNTGRRNHSTSVQLQICLRRIKERLVAAFTEDEVLYA